LRSTAETFKASLEATARQLADVAPWTAAFVFWEEGVRKKERIPPGQLVMPGLGDLGDPEPKLRVASCYRTASFRHFVPRNKSIADTSLVAVCSDDEPQTFGIDAIDLGKSTGTIELYCESFHAPYRRGDVVRRRVISLVLPVDHQTGTPESFTPYELEVF
jgi:hypothetical protein